MFQCPEPNCLYVHEHKANVQQHVKEVHDNVRPYKCTICGHAFKRSSHLRTHMITHEEREVFQCTHMACFFKTYHQHKFDEHVKTHTTSGPDNSLEAQVLAYFQPKYTCMTNKVDCTAVSDAYTYVLVDCVMVVSTTLVLLECDEKQHKDHTKYQVGNEVLRMKAASAALSRQYPHMPLLWVRFNPHGYKLDGRKQHSALPLRLAELDQFLKTYQPVQPVAVLYAGYDRLSCTTTTTCTWVVAVTRHPDYDPELAATSLYLAFEGEDAAAAATVGSAVRVQVERATRGEQEEEKVEDATEDQFKCTFCNSIFTHRHHMQRHVREVHMGQSRTDKNVFACPHDGCDKVYTQGHSLRTHIKAAHDGAGRVECPECHTWQSTQSNLQTHMRLKHGGQTKLQCPHCPFTTVYTQSLTKHIGRKHSESE